MSDNSDRSDFERSGSESDSSDSEYSSAFTSEEEESETETPVADSPEEDKKTRPSVNVVIGNFKVNRFSILFIYRSIPILLT